MSAFICSKEHYQFIADSLTEILKSKVYWLDSYKYCFDNLGIDYEKRESMTPQFIAEQLVAELQGLNTMAVAGRYQDNTLATQEIIQSKRFIDLNIIQLIKALNCVMYQCSENPVSGSPKYNQWKAFVDSLANAYVKNLKEYDLAEWEIN